MELVALAPALCLLECLYFLYTFHVRRDEAGRAEAFERLTWAFTGLVLAASLATMEAVYAVAHLVYPAAWGTALNSTVALAGELAEDASRQAVEYAKWAAYLGAVAGVIEGVQAALVVGSIATGGFSLALWLKLQLVKSAATALQAVAILGVNMASAAYAVGVVISTLCSFMTVAAPYMILGGLALLPSHSLRPLAKTLIVFGAAFGLAWPWAVGSLAGAIGLKPVPPAPSRGAGLVVLETWVNVSSLEVQGLPSFSEAVIPVSNVTVKGVVSEELPGPPGVALAYEDLETGRVVHRVVPGSVVGYTGKPPRRVFLELSGRYAPLYMIYSYVKLPVEVYWEYRNATHVFESGRGVFPVRPLEIKALELGPEIPPGVNYTLVRLYPRCSPRTCALVFRGETGVGWLRYSPGWAVELHPDYSEISSQYVELWAVLDPEAPGIQVVSGTDYAEVSYADGVVSIRLGDWEWSFDVPSAPPRVEVGIEGYRVSLGLNESALVPVSYVEAVAWAEGLLTPAQPVADGLSQLHVSVGGVPHVLSLRVRCSCKRAPSSASPALNFTEAFLSFVEVIDNYYAGPEELVQVEVGKRCAAIRFNETLWSGIGLDSSVLHLYRGDLIWSHAFKPYRVRCSARYYGEPLRPAVAYAQATGWPYLPGSEFVKTLPGGLMVDGITYMYNESAWAWLESDPLWEFLDSSSTATEPLFEALRDHAKIFNLSILILLSTAATFIAADVVSELVGGVSISGRLGLGRLTRSRTYAAVASALSAAASAATAAVLKVRPPAPRRLPPALVASLGLERPALRVMRAGWSTRVGRLRRGIRRLAEAYYRARPLTRGYPLPTALRAAAVLSEALSVRRRHAGIILRPRLYALSRYLKAASTLTSMKPPELVATGVLAASRALAAVAGRLAELRGRARLEELAAKVRERLPPELLGLEARPWVLRAVTEARGIRVRGLAELERAEEEVCRLADFHACRLVRGIELQELTVSPSKAQASLRRLGALRLGSLAEGVLRGDPAGISSYLALRASEEALRRILVGRAVSADVFGALARHPLYGPLLSGAAAASRVVAVGVEGVLLDPKELGRIKQAMQQLKPLDPVPRGLEPLYLRGLALGLRAWTRRVGVREGEAFAELEPSRLEERYGYRLDGFSTFELGNRLGMASRWELRRLAGVLPLHSYAVAAAWLGDYDALRLKGWLGELLAEGAAHPLSTGDAERVVKMASEMPLEEAARILGAALAAAVAAARSGEACLLEEVEAALAELEERALEAPKLSAEVRGVRRPRAEARRLRELLVSRAGELSKLEAALGDLEAVLRELEERGVELSRGPGAGFAVKLRLRELSRDLEGKVVEALGALERAEDLALKLLADGEEVLRILKSRGGGALAAELRAEAVRLMRLLSELSSLRSELEGLLDELEDLA